MARPSSKIMSIVEKKAATAGLKNAIKQHNDTVKLVNVAQKDADKVLALAKKAADVMVAEANKVLAAVSKDAAKLVADATKAHAAVVGKTAKSLAAAAKGTDKLATQLSALEAVEPAPVVKAAPAKAAKKTRELEPA